MSQWSINPSAAEQGRPITWLSYDAQENVIFSGYGDWGANGDRIAIVAHSVPDGAVSILFEPVASEAIGPVKRLQGHLYAPHIDPNTGYWSSEGGYASDESGEWANHALPGQAEHVFDMAETSAGLWACGSAIHPDQATIGPALWHRPIGGEWRVEYREPIPNGQDTAVRYYRIDVRDDRAVVQADGWVDGWTPALRAFDGIGRVDAPAEPFGWGYSPRLSIEVGGVRYSAGALGVIEFAPVAGDNETLPPPKEDPGATESEDDMTEGADDQIVGVDLHGRVDLSRFVTEAEARGAGGVDPGILHAATCRASAAVQVTATPVNADRTGLLTDLAMTGAMWITRAGVTVHASWSVWDGAGPQDLWRIEASAPLEAPGTPLKVGDGGLVVHYSDGARGTVPCWATGELRAGFFVADLSPGRVTHTGTPPAADATITGLVIGESWITADPAPPGSY